MVLRRDLDLRTLHGVAQGVAGGSAVSALDDLRLRRSLGHDWVEAHRLLPRFVAYLDAMGATTITIEATLGWAQQPDVDASTSVWPAG